MRQFIHRLIPMRDGVRLSTDVRLPDGNAKHPALLLRTPYSNADPGANVRYVNAGYALVHQDCRGRYDSEGTFAPFFEAEDGFDTIAWIRAQPWCDGRVGTIGASYNGTTQYTAAWLNPAGLRTITPRVMGHDAFKDMLYYQGAFNLSLAAGWGLAMIGRAGQSHATLDWNAVFRHLPLMTLDEAAGCEAPYFREWLSHPSYDSYWAAMSVEAHHGQFDIPILHMGGWYDIYSEGVIRNYAGIRAHGGPTARKHQRLLIGPWGHGLNTRTLGPMDYGPAAVTDLDGLESRWLARWVRDESNGVENEPPVRLFIMGTNVWRDEPEWPLARARDRAFHLVSGGRANSLYGDGALQEALPAGDETDAYLYNPENPVPTAGGCTYATQAGPTDHAPVERRDDVLVFTGPELREPMEVTGHVKMRLYAASDGPDTDFVARLCDVYPDGRSIIICDGITRARFREGLDREVFLQPGRVTEFEIEMGATANVFLPGHRIRLEVTSSCFPRFDRNLNTGEPIATGTRMRCARQVIHHSKAHPSRLVLPVVDDTRR